MPKDLQIDYIKLIREKWNPTNFAIATMMGVERANLSKYLLEVLGFEKQPRGAHPWDKEAFAEWCCGLPKTEERQSVQEEVKEEPVADVEENISVELSEEILDLIGEEFAAIHSCENENEIEQKKFHSLRMEAETEQFRKTVPTSGSMVFEDKAENILLTIAGLLGNTKVHLDVHWDVLED
jgi:hypothetical protein